MHRLRMVIPLYLPSLNLWSDWLSSLMILWTMMRGYMTVMMIPKETGMRVMNMTVMGKEAQIVMRNILIMRMIGDYYPSNLKNVINYFSTPGIVYSH